MKKRRPPAAFSPTDLRLLRVFRAVVRNKGFAAAQDELGLSPATISNHVGRLEQRFGIRLCERGRKGFSLTADGGRILDAAEALLRSVENFTSAVGSVTGELSGTVHLGMVDAMHTNRDVPLHKAIAAFTSAAPRVQLQVEIASPQELLQRLADGRYGAILTPIEAHHPAIVAERLYKEEQRLYCGRGHPLFGVRKGLTPGTVREHAYVSRSYMLDAVQTHDEGFNHRAATSHMEAIAILIMSGRFIGYLPAHFARSFVAAGEMRSLLDGKLAYFDTFYLALRGDERNRATLMLRDFLVDALRDMALA